MKYFLIGSVTLFIFSCNTSSNNQTLEIDSQAYRDFLKQATIINNNNAAAKTDAEVYADAALEIVGQAQVLAAEKRKSDSIKLATREAVWVYQIGLPKNSEEELWEVYERVQGFDNI